MLDNLLEIEAAYSLLAQKRKEDLDKDLLDVNYEKLKCTIAVRIQYIHMQYTYIVWIKTENLNIFIDTSLILKKDFWIHQM